MLLEIQNNGPEILSTNYWESEPAARGLLYLSGNAGALRLLVPPCMEHALDEMHTGDRIVIEPSVRMQGYWDIVFDDGTDAPFSVTIDQRAMDRTLASAGRCRLSVWTQAGKQLEKDCEIIA